MTERAPLPYVLLGAAAGAGQRSRAAAAAGVRAASVAAWPAAALWQSDACAGLRRRADGASAALAESGAEFSRQAVADARVVAAAVVRRAADEMVESGLTAELTSRVLESEELRRVLDHIMRSPEVRSALASQTAGLAGDVGAGMRSRTAVADDAAERFARMLTGRRRADA